MTDVAHARVAPNPQTQTASLAPSNTDADRGFTRLEYQLNDYPGPTRTALLPSISRALADRTNRLTTGTECSIRLPY